jgi:hypothetical protein
MFYMVIMSIGRKLTVRIGISLDFFSLFFCCFEGEGVISGVATRK